MSSTYSPYLVKAHNSLSELFEHTSLITFDRFSSAGRTCYSSGFGLDVLRPEIAAGYYDAWSQLGLEQSISVESETYTRGDSEKHIWAQILNNNVTNSIKRSTKQPLLSVWYSSDVTQKIASNCGGVELAIPIETRTILENKQNLGLLLSAAGVKNNVIIPYTNISGILPPYESLRKEFGNIIVVQKSHGSGGKGTFFIRSENDYRKLEGTYSNWKISKYISGISSNVTVLSLPNINGDCSVYVDIPSSKGTNSPEQGIAEGKSAGNEWSTFLTKDAIQSIIDSAVKIGRYAFSRYGLIGIWGIDFIIGDNDIKINEINPRIQGTTEVSALNQLMRGVPPFLASHIGHFGGAKVDWMPCSEAFNSQTIEIATTCREAPFYLKLRNTSGRTISCPFSKGSGVYKISNAEDDISWVRDGTSACDANLSQGEIFLANIPAHNVICYPNSELGTIEGITDKKLFSNNGGLTDLGERIVKPVKFHFGI